MVVIKPFKRTRNHGVTEVAWSIKLDNLRSQTLLHSKVSCFPSYTFAKTNQACRATGNGFFSLLNKRLVSQTPHDTVIVATRQFWKIASGRNRLE